jgi:hypothetical protein
MLLQRLTQFIKKPRVLYGNDSLSGEVLHQRNLLVRKWPDFLAVDCDDAEYAFVLTQRHLHCGACSTEIDKGTALRITSAVRLLRCECPG